MGETSETLERNKPKGSLHKRRRLSNEQTAESVVEAQSITVLPHQPPVSNSAALTNYRRWIESGAQHDENCFICGEPDNLAYCKTCRRSYHETCKPSNGANIYHEGTYQYFCDVCVGRGWHINAPEVTPLTLPDLAPPTRLVAQEGTQTGPGRPTEQRRATSTRKSRYSTLNTDVDSALRVLYVELEMSAELRQRNENLEVEVSDLRRELDLQKRECNLAQKSAEAARSANATMTQLQIKMSEMQAEVDTLHLQKQELEVELQNSQEQLKQTTGTLHEFKKTLAGLIKD